MPREWADGVVHLHAMAPLPGFTPRQWSDFLDACRRLLDGHGRELHQRGWKAHAVFGLDPNAPRDRIRRAGLALFLADAPTGTRVAGVRADSAILDMPNGTRQRFYKSKAGRGGVPAWLIARRND